MSHCRISDAATSSTGSCVHAALLAVCVLAPALTGCFSVSTMHTATPVPKGEAEIDARTGYVGVLGSAPPFPLAVNVPVGLDSQQRLINLPTLESQIRYGLGERLDGAIRFFPLGFGADVNYAPVLNSDLAVSFNPTISGTGFANTVLAHGALNVLVDAVKSPEWTLTVGAKQGYLLVRTGGRTFDFGIIGGMVMAEWQFADKVSLRPGIDVLYPVPNNQTGTVMTQGMLGINWRL